MLTDLVRKNVQFDVLFEDRILEENLRRYACVVVYEAELLSHNAVTALTSCARHGGRMIVYGQAGVMAPWGQPRKDNPMASDGPWDTARDGAAILYFVRKNITPSFEVLGCPCVLFTITEGRQSDNDGFVVHLLNYQKCPLENVRVRCSGGGEVSLVSVTPGCEQSGSPPLVSPHPAIGLLAGASRR